MLLLWIKNFPSYKFQLRFDTLFDEPCGSGTTQVSAVEGHRRVWFVAELDKALVHLESLPHKAPCWGRWGACEFDPFTVLEILLEPPSDLTASNYVRIDFGGVCQGCTIGMLED